MSHPAWVRELKRVIVELDVRELDSHPVRMRELKHFQGLLRVDRGLSRPVRMRELKPDRVPAAFQPVRESHVMWVRELKLDCGWHRGPQRHVAPLRGCVMN